jgi:hypothetical protein
MVQIPPIVVRGYGAGYIRFIPVGPLTTTAQDTNADGSVTTADHSVGKADLYLYGLTLGQSKKIMLLVAAQPTGAWVLVM